MMKGNVKKRGLSVGEGVDNEYMKYGLNEGKRITKRKEMEKIEI